jgi:hypothetical protein
MVAEYLLAAIKDFFTHHYFKAWRLDHGTLLAQEVSCMEPASPSFISIHSSLIGPGVDYCLWRGGHGHAGAIHGYHRAHPHPGAHRHPCSHAYSCAYGYPAAGSDAHGYAGAPHRHSHSCADSHAGAHRHGHAQTSPYHPAHG